MVEHNERSAGYTIQTITLFELITELLPFLSFSCAEKNFKTTRWNLIKLHTMVEHTERKCSLQEQ